MDAGIPSISSQISLFLSWHHLEFGSVMQFPSCPVGGVFPFTLQEGDPSVYELKYKSFFVCFHIILHSERRPVTVQSFIFFYAWGRSIHCPFIVHLLSNTLSIHCPFIVNGTEVGEGARLGFISCWSGSSRSIDHLTLALDPVFLTFFNISCSNSASHAMRRPNVSVGEDNLGDGWMSKVRKR